jgi:hypothetical protein
MARPAITSASLKGCPTAPSSGVDSDSSVKLITKALAIMTSDKSIGRAEAMRRSKRLVGYSRISTTAQDLQRQRQALKA